MVDKYSHYMLIPTQPIDDKTRDIIAQFAKVVLETQTCPPFIQRHLAQCGVVITQGHEQSIN